MGCVLLGLKMETDWISPGSRGLRRETWRPEPSVWVREYERATQKSNIDGGRCEARRVFLAAS